MSIKSMDAFSSVHAATPATGNAQPGVAAPASFVRKSNAENLANPVSPDGLGSIWRMARSVFGSSAAGDPDSVSGSVPRGMARGGVSQALINKAFATFSALGLKPGQQMEMKINGTLMVLRRTTDENGFMLQTPSEAEHTPLNGIFIGQGDNGQAVMRVNMKPVSLDSVGSRNAMKQMTDSIAVLEQL